MPQLVARFPHPVIGLVPMFANILAALAQHFLHFMVRFFVAEKMAHRFDHFAIDIKLQLFAGEVADSDRSRIQIAAQMRQRVLVWRTFAKDIVAHA